MLLIVLLAHVLLIAAVATMRSRLHLKEGAEPSVGVGLFRWPRFGPPEPPPKALAPRQRAHRAEGEPEPPDRPSPPTPSAPVAPIPAAPAAGGQLPAGVGRIIADHARCYGFQLTEEERAKCASRDLGREEPAGPLDVQAAKARAWDQDLQRRREPPPPAIVPCPRDAPGSNLGAGCVGGDAGARIPLR